MNHLQTNTVTSHIHLGLTFSNDILWHEHYESIKTKAWHRVNVMRELKFPLNRKSLQTIHLSDADVLWANCTQYQANESEKNPTRSRIHCHWRKKTSFHWKLLREIGWDTLSCRRKKPIIIIKLILFYKMRYGLCPEYLSLLPHLVTVGNNILAIISEMHPIINL